MKYNNISCVFVIRSPSVSVISMDGLYVCEMLAITPNYVCLDLYNVLSVNHSYHKYENGHEMAHVCLMVITAENRELGWLVKVPKSF